MAFLLPAAAAAGAGTAAAGIGAGIGTAAASASLSTAATAGLGLASLGRFANLAGSGISAIGGLMQGNAQSAAAKNNAIVARERAENKAKEGEMRAEQEMQKTRAEVAGIKANQGASGVDLGSDSSIDVRSSAEELGELNAINIRANAAREAYGYQTESANYLAESKNDKTSGMIGAAGTLLGGIGNTYTNYENYRRFSSL